MGIQSSSEEVYQPAINKRWAVSLPKQFDRLTAAKHPKKPTGIFGKSLERS
jgi:hypothetical protein